MEAISPWETELTVQWSGVDDQLRTRHIAIVGPRRGKDGRTETCYTALASWRSCSDMIDRTWIRGAATLNRTMGDPSRQRGQGRFCPRTARHGS